MKKTLTKIGKFFARIFKFLYKILDIVLITPLSKAAYFVYDHLSSRNTTFDKFLNNPNTLVYISLVCAVALFFAVDKKVINLNETEAIVLSNQTVKAEYNEEVYKEVKKYLKQYKEIEHSKIHLLKCGPYYNLQLSLDIIPTLTLKKAETLINKIKSDLMKNKELKINYVIIYICDSL